MRERIYDLIFARTLAGPAPRRRVQAGFTLVELLVVVAIISVLAGLLLPVLDKGVRVARSASCQNNLKQIWLAAEQYSGDYNDYLVPIFSPGDGPSGSLNHWTGLLRGYFSVNRTTAFAKSTDLPVAVCAESPKRFGYGYNYAQLGYYQADHGYIRFHKSTEATRPSATLAFSDVSMTTLPDPSLFTSWRSYVRQPTEYGGSYWDNLVYFVHSGTANVLWLEGHVSSRLEGDGLLYGVNAQKEWWDLKK